MHVCRPIWMLASPWIPWQKPNMMGVCFFFGIWIIAENKVCDQHKFIQIANVARNHNVGGPSIKCISYQNRPTQLHLLEYTSLSNQSISLYVIISSVKNSMSTAATPNTRTSDRRNTTPASNQQDSSGQYVKTMLGHSLAQRPHKPHEINNSSRVSIHSCEFNLCAKLKYHIKTFANKHRFHPTSQREQNRHFLVNCGTKYH